MQFPEIRPEILSDSLRRAATILGMFLSGSIRYILLAPLAILVIFLALTPAEFQHVWLQNLSDIKKTYQAHVNCHARSFSLGDADFNPRINPLRPSGFTRVYSGSTAGVLDVEKQMQDVRRDREKLQEALQQLEEYRARPDLTSEQRSEVARAFSNRLTCLSDLDREIADLENIKQDLKLIEPLRHLSLALRAIALGCLGALAAMFLLSSKLIKTEEASLAITNKIAFSRACFGGFASLLVISIMESQLLSLYGDLPNEISSFFSDARPDYWRSSVLGIGAGMFADSFYTSVRQRIRPLMVDDRA